MILYNKFTSSFAFLTFYIISRTLLNVSSRLILGMIHPLPKSASNSFEVVSFQVSTCNGSTLKTILRLLWAKGSPPGRHHREAIEVWVICVCHDVWNKWFYLIHLPPHLSPFPWWVLPWSPASLMVFLYFEHP